MCSFLDSLSSTGVDRKVIRLWVKVWMAFMCRMTLIANVQDLVRGATCWAIGGTIGLEVWGHGARVGKDRAVGLCHLVC